MTYYRFDIYNGCKTCGVYMGDDIARHATHDAWHNSMGQTLDLPPAPPTPPWREMVEERRKLALAFIRVNDETPLGEVLYRIYSIIADTNHRAKELAAIVAIAEAEIGNGWQANPTCWWQSHSPDVDSLLDALNEKGADRWEKLGYRAAAWLRDLTEGGEA